MIEFTAWGVHIKIWATQIVGLIGACMFVYVLWRAQKDPKNPINFATMLVWPGTDQTSLALVGTLGGMLTATWVIVDLSLRNHLTEGYFGLYLGILVTGKAATEWVNGWRDRGPAPPPATNQIIDKAMNVNAAPPDAAPSAVPAPQPAAVAPTPKPRARKHAPHKRK